MNAVVRISNVRFKPGFGPAGPVPRASTGGAQGWPGAYFPLSSGFAYDAESMANEELGTWSPWLRSPDTELNWYRDRRVARSRDLERNDGYARGAITRTVDDTIGSLFRLVVTPDWRMLSRINKTMDQVWAQEFADAIEGEWRNFAEDPAFWSDLTRQASIVQMFRLQLRHKLIDGESLLMLPWDPDAVGPGRARFATRVQLIDPDRLSNPFDQTDSQTMRGGVEIDVNGAPLAYHIRKAHQYDMYDVVRSMQWERMPRETEWGRPIMVHDLDPDRVAQHRGLGVLVPVLAEFKNLTRYDRAELSQALLQTAIGTFIESPYDPDQVAAAMQASSLENTELNAYQDMRYMAHEKGNISIGGVRIPMLTPGEKIASVPPRHPSANFEAFQSAVLRKVASALGMTAEQITQDYSKANYSSLRAALLTSWRTMKRRRADFATGTATPVYSAFLEEALDMFPELLPRNAPSWLEYRAAYCRCKWTGPGRGWIDPVKERQGVVLGLDAGLSTLEDEVADISGGDWKEALEQRAQETAEFHRLGLRLPEWAGPVDATESTERPTAE